MYEYNQRAQRTYTRLGFRPEGRQRAAVFHDGRFHDRILMGLLANEYPASPAAGWQQPARGGNQAVTDS
ncbi:GNAT family N-acetyltransferase [Arthrobacter sp. JCM 19049]|uniref:GNAT family N-acetyltransferase n=1 Tax=Arthrobacter sp. JCM 19049 TaxID=1460643 RepID=UPI0006D02C81|nr:GNAT family protein [Arthrobacter sp. JCM 19049]